VKLIAGLGNPGPEYADSRHNIGYLVADELARRWRIDLSRLDRRFEAVIAEAHRAGERVRVIKPVTFMNRSGWSVAAAWRFYKLTLPDLLVIYDDLDLPVGGLRIRAQGSAGGHKGLEDVIRHLGSSEVSRIRIGIGKVHRTATVSHVLGTFAPDERPMIEAAVATAADAAECWLARGIDAAMNEFNRKDGDAS
jgi:PTH1 family peptidyl-tRNA hydrolase